MPPQHTLRLVQFNTRRFTRMRGQESTVVDVSRALVTLRPHIVTLNEVDVGRRPEALETLVRDLTEATGCAYSFEIFGHVAGRYGNAVLSRFPIVGRCDVDLKGGTEVKIPAGRRKPNGEIAQEGDTHRIARGMLMVDVQVPPPSAWDRPFAWETPRPFTQLRVACTHLDHMSIEQRRVQLDHVAAELGSAAQHPELVLMGDLNALDAADYNVEQWAALEQRARDNSWAPPASGDLDVLSSIGLADAFKVHRDSDPAQADSSSSRTAHVGEPLYRIDYCFLRSQKLAVNNTRVAREVEASDHYPIVVDLVARG